MKRNPLGLGRHASVVLAASALFCAPSVHAETKTWTAAGGNWDTPVSWISNGTPLSTDDAVFAGAGGVINPPTTAGATSILINNIEFASGVYSFAHSASSRSIEFNALSGAMLSSVNFTHTSTSAATWVLVAKGDTAFTGTFSNNGTYALALTKSGVGTLDIRQATTAYTGVTRVTNGILRVNGAASGKGVIGGPIELGTNATKGVLEIDANGANFTFAKTLSASAGGIRLGSSNNGGAGSVAGFGALNGNVTITLDSGASVSWNNANFFRTLGLQLGTETSTHRTIFSNNLSMNGSRTITAGNGAAAIDGEFSGALGFAGVGSGDFVLTKDGLGTMLLSGNSASLAGRLHVTEGKLLVGGSLATTTNNATYGVRVDAGSTLGGGGTVTLSNAATKMAVGGTLQAGEGLADKTLTLSTNLEMETGSTLAFAIKGTDESDKISLTGGSWTFQINQKVHILDIGVSDEGGQFALITGLTGFGAYDFSNWQVTSTGPVGSLLYSGNTLYYQVVPEPSSLAVAGLGLGVLILSFRRRKAA